MKIYRVGGAVRDRLLGLPPGDQDYVVVGSTPQAMLAAGYLPVGKDFPVFLHPITHEEYALARTERKTGHGYHGFSVYAAPDVTLEDDLARRDLTVNAMAEAVVDDAAGDAAVDNNNGPIIDPYGGQRDLAQRLLRHVSPAFAEDPVRILRLARFAAQFAARFPEFSVAPETQALLRQMVQAGETRHLVAERVWKEISRGLMTQRPERMFAVLDDCGASDDLFGQVPQIAGRLDRAAAQHLSLPVRSAVWLAECSPQQVRALSARLSLPGDCRDMALLLTEHGAELLQPTALSTEAQLSMLERCDGLRRPARFADLCTALPCLGTSPLDASPGVVDDWLQIQKAAASVDAGAIALAARTAAHIPAAIREARIAAIQNHR